MRGKRRAAPRLGRGVAGERPGVLGDRAEADAVLVAPGEQRGPGRRADGRHVEAVVGQAHLLHPSEGGRADRSAERVDRAEAGVVDEDDEHVGRALGRLRSGDHRPVGDRVAQRAPGRSAEGRVGDRQHGAVGVELPRRLGQRVLEAADALLVHLGDRLGRRAGSARSAASRSSSSTIAMIAAVPGFSLSPMPVSRPLRPCAWRTCRSCRRPAAPTTTAPSIGGANRPTSDADPAAPASALATQMVAGVGDLDLAGRVVLDQDHALGPDLLVLDELTARRSPSGPLNRRVAGQDQSKVSLTAASSHIHCVSSRLRPLRIPMSGSLSDRRRRVLPLAPPPSGRLRTGLARRSRARLWWPRRDTYPRRATSQRRRRRRRLSGLRPPETTGRSPGNHWGAGLCRERARPPGPPASREGASEWHSARRHQRRNDMHAALREG